MNKKQVVRLNEEQLKRIVAESVKNFLNEGLQNWFERPAGSEPSDYFKKPEPSDYNDNASEYSDLIKWIRGNVEDYVTCDDTKIMQSKRVGFDTDGFIRSLIKFLG